MAGGSMLLPTDPYARWEVTTWCRWIIERIAPAAAFIGTRATLNPALAAIDEAAFEALSAAIESVDLRARWTAVRAGDFDDGKLADSEAKIDAAVARIEKQLEGQDWLFGQFGLADLESYAWLSSMVVFVPLAFTHATRTQSWMERVARRSSVARALSLASVPDPRRSWAPGPEINRWG
jgi:glutathione S-transferase